MHYSRYSQHSYLHHIDSLAYTLNIMLFITVLSYLFDSSVRPIDVRNASIQLHELRHYYIPFVPGFHPLPSRLYTFTSDDHERKPTDVETVLASHDRPYSLMQRRSKFSPSLVFPPNLVYDFTNPI